MTAGLALAARKAAISWALPLLLLVAWEMASRAGDPDVQQPAFFREQLLVVERLADR